MRVFVFTKKNSDRSTVIKQPFYKEGCVLPVMPAKRLLAAGRYPMILRQLKDISKLPSQYFEVFYKKAIHNFAEFVQVIPLDFNHALGSLMDQSIARAVIALRIYQIEYKDNVDPLKSYAIFTAALFQNISCVLIQQRVLLTEKSGQFIRYWNPMEGSMVNQVSYYRLIPLAHFYQRLDHTLRHLFARQIMPKSGYHWIASDLSLLADWFDAISGKGDSRGTLAHILTLIKNEDLIDLQNLLVQDSIEQQEALDMEHGLAFYHWLKDHIQGRVEFNTIESDLHITSEGLFIERKLFKDFTKIYNKPVADTVVYAQFGNLMGLVKKGGADFMNAQYFSESMGRSATSGRTFGSPVSNTKSSLRHGILLSEPAMLLDKTVPVSSLLHPVKSSNSHLPALDLPQLTTRPQAKS